MAVTGKVASVLARLKNQAKTEGISFQVTLQLFFQEEFLRRLAKSKYRDNFILKGGMFIYTLTEFESRPTQDMDFLLRSLSNDLLGMEKTMREICDIDSGNDYICLEVTGMEKISTEKKYPGIRTKFIGRIENIRVPFAVDMGVDDIIVPGAKLRKFATKLPDFEALEIYTYSIESTLAEKFDAILLRMETTSRMKDFYDIYYLSGIFDFDGSVLVEALNKTLTHRGRELPDNALKRIVDFANNKFLLQQWNGFKPAKETELPFSDALQRVVDFMGPIYNAAAMGESYDKRWLSGCLEWRRKIPTAFGVADATKMTTEEFDECLQKGFEDIQNGRGCTLEEAFSRLEKDIEK